MRTCRFPAFCLLVFLASCTIKPEPIQYGIDGCSFCSMTIVDRQHAAEYVTSKGKVYKFDAAECMMNELREWDLNDIALVLVTDYEMPGEWVNAMEATFLISENIPSPMGANLSAFKERDAAERVRDSNNGLLLTWDELRERYKGKLSE